MKSKKSHEQAGLEVIPELRCGEVNGGFCMLHCNARTRLCKLKLRLIVFEWSLCKIQALNQETITKTRLFKENRFFLALNQASSLSWLQVLLATSLARRGGFPKDGWLSSIHGQELICSNLQLV